MAELNVAWKERQVSEDWQKAVIVPMWKNKGNKIDCERYNCISLFSHAGMMYAKIFDEATDK